ADVRRAIALIMLLVVVDAVERTRAGPDAAANERALARALATARDAAAQRADGGAAERADAGILRGVEDLVVAFPLRAAHIAGHAVTLRDDRLRRHALGGG